MYWGFRGFLTKTQSNILYLIKHASSYDMIVLMYSRIYWMSPTKFVIISHVPNFRYTASILKIYNTLRIDFQFWRCNRNTVAGRSKIQHRTLLSLSLLSSSIQSRRIIPRFPLLLSIQKKRLNYSKTIFLICPVMSVNNNRCIFQVWNKPT